MRKEWVVAQAGRTAQIMEETFHEVVRSNTVLLPGTKSKFTAEIRSNPFIYFLNLFCSLDLRPSPFYPFTLCVVPTPRRTKKHNRSCHNPTFQDTNPKGSFSLAGYDVRPTTRFGKDFCFEICHPTQRTYYMYAESQEEQESWQSYLLCATVPLQWGGVGVTEFAGRGRRGRASVGEAEAAAELASGMQDLPRLRQAHAWKRRALLRRKMILCTIQFNFHQPKQHEQEKEQKRLALLELIDYCDNVRGAFNDPSIFHDLMRMIQENLW